MILALSHDTCFATPVAICLRVVARPRARLSQGKRIKGLDAAKVAADHVSRRTYIPTFHSLGDTPF